MRIVWLPGAVRSLQQQIDYIAERDPRAAARLETAIVEAVAHLTEHPNIGRTGRVAGTRELVVARTPFVVVYVIERVQVIIIRVLHSAQRWPLLR